MQGAVMIVKSSDAVQTEERQKIKKTREWDSGTADAEVHKRWYARVRVCALRASACVVGRSESKDERVSRLQGRSRSPHPPQNETRNGERDTQQHHSETQASLSASLCAMGERQRER